MSFQGHVHIIHEKVSFCKSFFYTLVIFLHNPYRRLAFWQILIRFDRTALANHLSILQKQAPADGLPGPVLCNFTLANCFGTDFFTQLGGEFLQTHGAQILAAAGADGDGLVLHIPVAHYQHIGNLLQRGLPDLLADLLVAVVHLHAEALASSAADSSLA